MFRKRESYNFKQASEKTEAKVRSTRTHAEKLDKEAAELSTQIEGIRKEAEELHQNRLNRFKHAIRPLEETGSMLEEEKEMFGEKAEAAERALL